MGGRESVTTVAVMQPYFAPYAGYFRLFAAADLFVVYDCVQFPRRGWVHRNRFIDQRGVRQWLTLPVAHCAQQTAIANLRFAADAQQRMAERTRSLPSLGGGMRQALANAFWDFDLAPAEYLCRLLQAITRILKLERPMIRSSELGLPQTLRGQERILEVIRRTGADRYINAPGGRSLYETHVFAERGVELTFLDEYGGSMGSVVDRLHSESPDAIAMEIQTNL